MNNKTELDYLNYTELNYIEDKIDEYTDKVALIATIPAYTKKTWAVNDLPFIQEIDRIETGIKNLAEYYDRPVGWQTTKQWITSDNLYPIKSFDYRDFNRWLNNLNLFEEDFEEEVTLWNGVSFYDWQGHPLIYTNIQYNNEDVQYNSEDLMWGETD